MKRMIPLLITLLLIMPVTPAIAGHLETVHLLPIAGHAEGANGTFWRTDLSVFNPGPTAITLEIVFVDAGEGRTGNLFALESREGESLTVPPRSSIRLEDILGDREGLENVTGALIIGAEQPFALTSRSFTTAAPGGTFGQTVSPAIELIHQTGEKLLLPALVLSEASRSNLGVAAAADSAGDLQLEIRLLAADGALTGSRTMTIPAGEINQLQVPVAAIDSTPLSSGAAEIEIISGSGAVSAYASVVDNVTGDAVLVPAAADSPLFPSSLHATELLDSLLNREDER